MKLAVIAAALAMAAPAAGQRLGAPNITTITVETTSWGRLIARWTIDDSGDLRYTSPEPDVFNAAHYVTRQYKVGRQGFGRIRAILTGAERSRRPLKCRQAVTDAVYGKVTWDLPGARERTLSFYTACSERATRTIVGQIGEADTLARNWAMRGQVIKTVKADRAQ